MLRVIMFSAVVFACASKSNNDAVAVPADSVLQTEANFNARSPLTAGAISLDSLLYFDSESELKKVFGKYVSRSSGVSAEGMGEYTNSLLFADTDDQVEFLWNDTIHFSGLDFLRIAGKHSIWKTREGITLGTGLDELEKLNGKPFLFYGLGWDYSGTINWNEGKLATRNIYAALAYPQEEMPSEWDGLLGDGEISSQNLLAKKAQLVLREISLHRN